MNINNTIKDWRKYLAELIGTMIFTFVSIGAIAIPAADLSNLGIANIFLYPLAVGAAFAVIYFIIHPISGCHLNPAVSLGFAMRKKLSWKDFGLYAAAQIIGAFSAIIILLITFKILSGGASFNIIGNTLKNFGPKYANGMFGIMFLEIIASFIFILAFFCIVHRSGNKDVTGFIIGAALLVLTCTGATLNPAINFSRGLFGGASSARDIWLYVLLPFGGAALAALTSRIIFKEQRKPKEIKAEPELQYAEVVSEIKE